MQNSAANNLEIDTQNRKASVIQECLKGLKPAQHEVENEFTHGLMTVEQAQNLYSSLSPEWTQEIGDQKYLRAQRLNSSCVQNMYPMELSGLDSTVRRLLSFDESMHQAAADAHSWMSGSPAAFLEPTSAATHEQWFPFETAKSPAGKDLNNSLSSSGSDAETQASAAMKTPSPKVPNKDIEFVLREEQASPLPQLPTSEQDEPTLADVESAINRISGLANRMPILHSEFFGAHLKLENLQKAGAYKVRGALNTLAIAVERGDMRPVIAASAGNHGRGVAYAARHFGLKATIVVPENAPTVKVEGCLKLGAEVIHHGSSFDEACERAHELTAEHGWNFVHAFDNPNVVAGQGTMGPELMDVKPDVVVVPIGGGGLISGLGLYLPTQGVRIVGAQVVDVDNMARKMEGQAVLPELAPTIADGVRVQKVGALTEKLCLRHTESIIRVTEAEVRRTVAELAVHEHVVAEGAGAVAVAALKYVEGNRKVAIVTGGNIDPGLLAELLTGKV